MTLGFTRANILLARQQSETQKGVRDMMELAPNFKQYAPKCEDCGFYKVKVVEKDVAIGMFSGYRIYCSKYPKQDVAEGQGVCDNFL